MDEPFYAEFSTRSNFSFLQGASHPEELAVTAMRLGHGALGLADRNTVAGVVRAHMAAKEARLAYHPGARLVFSDGTPDMLAYPRHRTGWGHLCRLLTAGNLRGEKGAADLRLEDVLEWGQGLNLALVAGTGTEPGEHATVKIAPLHALKGAFGNSVRLAAAPRFGVSDRHFLDRAAADAHAGGVPLMAVGGVDCHAPSRKPLADVLASIRLAEPVARAGFQLAANAEGHLKPAAEMVRLFRHHPDAIRQTRCFHDELSFSLDELRYEYPDDAVAPGETPQAALEMLAWQGAERRYPQGVPQKVEAQIRHELSLIAELDYARYFLTVWDIVRFAREVGILCQGRGSAANSTVCFCIGITEVDPALSDLLFERFISPERREPPDIDVDFEHERREEVIQYIYQRYGHERAGLAATVITYRARSATREVAKAFGLSEDALSAMSASIWGWNAADIGAREATAAGLDPQGAAIRQMLDMTGQIGGFPRHLSQHVGGFVITKSRLDEVVPIMKTAMEGRTMVEWDKDDLDSLGILKIDILALGMLTCLSRALVILKEHYGRALTLATIPQEEPAVYDMICRADTLGVFQIESRAQMTMLPRLKPRKFYDLVIEVAIVRPGPIQGDMVHPYLRRRQGKESVSYPSKELEEVLGRTLGVPLFQEQAMKIAIVAGGFTPSEADKLRRAMATFRRVGTIHMFQQKMVDGMVDRGYEKDFAERCFRQIEGFGEYGFPESHAASFALLVYASCWLKAHYPDVFCAAMLNAQPLGFYAPAQLVRDACEHGVDVRPVDVNKSNWDAALEEGAFNASDIHPRHRDMANVIMTDKSVRLGLRSVKGLRQTDMDQLVARRGEGYDSVRDLAFRSGLSRAVIERLADADAFRSLGLDRRDALWAVKALDPAPAADALPLFALAQNNAEMPEAEMRLPRMRLGEQVVEDYRHLSLSLKSHPLTFLRAGLERERVTPNDQLGSVPSGRRVTVAGLVLVRQRPGSAKGVIFMTLEDEGHVANVIVWPKLFEKYRAIVIGSRLVKVTGKLQSESGVIHIVADHVEDISGRLSALTAATFGDNGLASADEVRRPVMDHRSKPKARARMAAILNAAKPHAPPQQREPGRKAEAVMPKGRNFR
ncbi:MAG: error-prone DNA polymerase [Rhizobiaceae bacterium]